MGQVKHFDWTFQPVTEWRTTPVFAIQAITDDGRVVGQASLVHTVWAASAEGRRTLTFLNGQGSVPDITDYFTAVIASEESKGEAAQ